MLLLQQNWNLMLLKFCLRRKGSFEAIARQLFWIFLSSLQKSAHWFADLFVVHVASIRSIWFATMQNHLNFSKHLLIMFLPCIKSKQVLQTSQNHKWMSFWRWLDLIRRRSLRSLISAKIVWMYFLVITSRCAMRNYGRFLWLYLRFCMIKFTHKRASQSQRCDCPQHNLTAHFLWWHLTTFKQQGFRFSNLSWNEKELQSL